MSKCVGLLLIGLMALSAQAEPPRSLKGEWRFSEMIYRGQIMPLPNPDLNLTWTFFENGTERLYWGRKGESSFCERFAHYELRDDKIIETVFAVNPQNGIECANDPDMQVGRQTSNTIEIKNNQIHFHMQMGDEELIYVLKEVL